MFDINSIFSFSFYQKDAQDGGMPKSSIGMEVDSYDRSDVIFCDPGCDHVTMGYLDGFQVSDDGEISKVGDGYGYAVVAGLKDLREDWRGTCLKV